jgi:hypothetical protein
MSVWHYDFVHRNAITGKSMIEEQYRFQNRTNSWTTMELTPLIFVDRQI